MKETKLLVETNEYSLRLLSDRWCGPVILYISNDHFGDAGLQLERSLSRSIKSSFTFCELCVKDWDSNLTPWEAEANFKGRSFQGNGKKFLDSMNENVIPKIREYAKVSKLYIAGYSLAGLFALWSLYECDSFDGAVCCSGSVWYPKWTKYLTEHSLIKKSRVYLSLGDKEKNTKHPLMRMVEDNMNRQYQVLLQDPNTDMLHMDMNKGGHFDQTQPRMEMGITWILTFKEAM